MQASNKSAVMHPYSTDAMQQPQALMLSLHVVHPLQQLGNCCLPATHSASTSAYSYPSEAQRHKTIQTSSAQHMPQRTTIALRGTVSCHLSTPQQTHADQTPSGQELATQTRTCCHQCDKPVAHSLRRLQCRTAALLNAIQ